jgi:multiple sugar transport system substrate-binding protein
MSPEVLGIRDPLTVQLRVAAFRVGKGELSIDEAAGLYGSFE